MIPSALTQQIVEKLGYYVYLYRDPESSSIFYVGYAGKGKGDQALTHLGDTSVSRYFSAHAQNPIMCVNC